MVVEQHPGQLVVYAWGVRAGDLSHSIWIATPIRISAMDSSIRTCDLSNQNAGGSSFSWSSSYCENCADDSERTLGGLWCVHPGRRRRDSNEASSGAGELGSTSHNASRPCILIV